MSELLIHFEYFQIKLVISVVHGQLVRALPLLRHLKPFSFDNQICRCNNLRRSIWIDVELCARRKRSACLTIKHKLWWRLSRNRAG